MKTTKLLKILASLAIVASISACGGGKKPAESSEPVETPEEVTIAQATGVEFDSETNTFVAAKEGVLVTIKDNLLYVGEIGNGRILAGTLNPNDEGTYSLADQYGIEAEMAEGVKLVTDDGETALGYTDRINLTGRVTLEKGRVVLKEASYKFVSEGERRNVYWPAERDYFDYMSEPTKSGLLMQGTVQLVSIPTTYDPATGATIKVVFPGEKTVDSLENDFIFNVDIPTGLTQEQFGKYTEMFADSKVGDGYKLTFALRYNGSMGGIIPFHFLGRSFSSGELWFEPAELEGVYTDFDDVLLAMSDFCDAGLFVGFDGPNSYSYKLDLSNAKTDYSTASYCYINVEYDVVGRIDYKIYTDDAVADIEALLDAVLDNNVTDAYDMELQWFIGGWWNADDETPSDYDDIYQVLFLLGDPEEDADESLDALFDGSEETSEEEPEENIYAEVIVEVGEGYLSVIVLTELTLPVSGEWEDFEDALAAYEAEEVYDGESALFPAFESDLCVGYGLDWSTWDAYASYGIYSAYFYGIVALADYSAYIEEVETNALAAGGVVANSAAYKSQPAGIWFADSMEFTFVNGIYYHNEEHTLVEVVFNVDIYLSESFIVIPTDESESAAGLAQFSNIVMVAR